MKPVLFLAAAAAVVLAAAPAVTQTSAPPVADTMGTPPNVLSLAGSPYGGPDGRQDASTCFNGDQIAGVNRSGAETLLVQPRRGPIFQLRLAESCDALKSAQKIRVRADGNVVCRGQAATLVSETPDGRKQCRISDVRRLTPTEVAALASATAR